MALALSVFAACGGGVNVTPAALPDDGPSTVRSEEQIDSSKPIRAVFETSAMQLHTLGTARILFSFNETPAGIGGGVRIWVVNGTFEQRVYKHRHAIVRYQRSASQVTISGRVPLGGELGTLTFSGTITGGKFTFSGTDALGALSGVTSRAGPYLTGPAKVSAAEQRRPLSIGGCETVPPYLGTYLFGPTGRGPASAQNPVSPTGPNGEPSTSTVQLTSATNDGQGGYTYAGELDGWLWQYGNLTAFNGIEAELYGNNVNVEMTSVAVAYIFSFSWYMPDMFRLIPRPAGYVGPPQYERQGQVWNNSGYNVYSGFNPITPCYS